MTGVMTSAQLLARVSLFAECAPEELASLARLLQPRRFDRGGVIFHQGDPGAAMYVVEDGRVAIGLSAPEGKDVTLALLGPGDFFGELALLDGEARSADARAAEPTRLLSLRRDDFLGFLQAHPHVPPILLAALSRRLRRTDQIVHDAAFLDIPTRLAKILLDLGRSQGQPGPEGLVITSRFTQADLAAMVGATRESINKWLRSFTRQGLISYRRGRLVLLDPRRLGQGIS